VVVLSQQATQGDLISIDSPPFSPSPAILPPSSIPFQQLDGHVNARPILIHPSSHPPSSPTDLPSPSQRRCDLLLLLFPAARWAGSLSRLVVWEMMDREKASRPVLACALPSRPLSALAFDRAFALCCSSSRSDDGSCLAPCSLLPIRCCRRRTRTDVLELCSSRPAGSPSLPPPSLLSPFLPFPRLGRLTLSRTCPTPLCRTAGPPPRSASLDATWAACRSGVARIAASSCPRCGRRRRFFAACFATSPSIDLSGSLSRHLLPSLVCRHVRSSFFFLARGGKFQVRTSTLTTPFRASTTCFPASLPFPLSAPANDLPRR
jgi:hypothetical protein